MASVITPEFMAMIARVQLQTSIRLKNNPTGGRRSQSKGSSVEFSDYRIYSPGDDFRRIDWNALARFEKVFIKCFMEEQEIPVTIFLDKSLSMEETSKQTVSLQAVATFAYQALNAYDTVSCVGFSDRIVSERRNIRGGTGFYPLIQGLEQSSYEGNTDLYTTIKQWENRFRTGLTVIISDLLYDHQLDNVLSLLRFKKQSVIVCHTLSMDEISPSLNENTRFKDKETQSTLSVNAREDALAIYEEKLQDYLATIGKICEKHRANYFLVNTGEGIQPFIEALIRNEGYYGH